MYAQHWISYDAEHILGDLRDRFDTVLAELEALAGGSTARVQRPVLILGSLDGIETGVRQLIRKQPLETTRIQVQGSMLTVPTPAEILRIKAALILKRNATRDYLDFVALTYWLGSLQTADAMRSFDRFYPQPSHQSALQQLLVQLTKPIPYDLDDIHLDEYKNLSPLWRRWEDVENQCIQCAVSLFDALCDRDLAPV